MKVNQKEILHIMILDKFLPPFIDFIAENFGFSNHIFVMIDKIQYKYGLTIEHPVIWIDKKYKYFKLLMLMYKAEKIIIHGLWNDFLIKLLYYQPWLLKKSYWVMWGGDFYFPETQNVVKKQVIKNMGHFITYIRGDYELVQKWYGAKGEYHECLMYPSNLYKELNIKPKEHSTINIQVGNSATETNHHFEVLEKLTEYKNEDIKIFCPLSYGDMEYGKEVIVKGKELFGDKFVPITEFMPFQKYLEFLGNIDIAIFALNRQQAMGNIITLLGLGKKVYLRKNTTPWNLFRDIGLKVFDLDEINLDKIGEQTKINNQLKVREYFSKTNYIKQLNNIFGV